MDVGNIFGNRLKTLRNMREKSQREFSSELGIPASTLSAYENGNVKPTVDVLIKIAERCGVSVDWLCGRDEPPRIIDLGDVMALLLELYEINEFNLKTTIQDRVDIEGNTDEEKNWINIRAYWNESRQNPECVLDSSFCSLVRKAYELTESYKQYAISKETYEREKAYWIEYYKKSPVSKIDLPEISFQERQARWLKRVEEEQRAIMEAQRIGLNKKDD